LNTNAVFLPLTSAKYMGMPNIYVLVFLEFQRLISQMWNKQRAETNHLWQRRWPSWRRQRGHPLAARTKGRRVAFDNARKENAKVKKNKMNRMWGRGRMRHVFLNLKRRIFLSRISNFFVDKEKPKIVIFEIMKPKLNV